MISKELRHWESECAYSAQAKFRHDAPSPPSFVAAIFHRCRSRVSPESVQLELGLVANLRGKRLVSGDIEVGSAGHLIRAHELPGLDIAQNSNVGHCHDGGGSV